MRMLFKPNDFTDIYWVACSVLIDIRAKGIFIKDFRNVWRMDFTGLRGL